MFAYMTDVVRDSVVHPVKNLARYSSSQLASIEGCMVAATSIGMIESLSEAHVIEQVVTDGLVVGVAAGVGCAVASAMPKAGEVISERVGLGGVKKFMQAATVVAGVGGAVAAGVAADRYVQPIVEDVLSKSAKQEEVLSRLPMPKEIFKDGAVVALPRAKEASLGLE